MEGPIEPIFLPFMCRLRVFELHLDPFSSDMNDFVILSLLILSLRASLTAPATLEHLKFKIVYSGKVNRFNQDDFFYEFRDHANVWSDFDSISTHPTGSRLQRVDIRIEYDFRDEDNVGEENLMEHYDIVTKFSEPVLDALPLLRKKGILFVEVTAFGSEPE